MSLLAPCTNGIFDDVKRFPRPESLHYKLQYSAVVVYVGLAHTKLNHTFLYSNLLTMNIFLFCANTVHVLAFYLLISTIVKKQNCYGISGQTQLLYLTVFICRYLDVLTTFVSWYNVIMKIAFVSLTLALIYLIYYKYNKSHVEYASSWNLIGLILPAAILGVCVNFYTLSGDWNLWSSNAHLEILWTFSIYLEVVAILPQYYMCKKTVEGTRVLPYVVTLCTYRSLYICNWIYRYTMENHFDPISSVSGCVQTLILIMLIVHIQQNEEKSPKWQEITQVFTIEAAKSAGENTKSFPALYKIDVEPLTLSK